MGLTLPFSHQLQHRTYLQVSVSEADALPLLWELYSGGGVNCGASKYFDWKQFRLLSHFIGSFRALLPINCTLSLKNVKSCKKKSTKKLKQPNSQESQLCGSKNIEN